MKKISVVIPTLQRDVETLNNLVSTLVNDAMVDEILIIDNSLQNYSFNIETFNTVQNLLLKNATNKKHALHSNDGSLLTGLLFEDVGNKGYRYSFLFQ